MFCFHTIHKQLSILTQSLPVSEVKTSLALVANIRDFQAFTVPAAGSPASAMSTQSCRLAHNARRDHQTPPWHHFLPSLSPFIPVLWALTDKVFPGSPGSSFYQLSDLRAMASSPLLPLAPVRAPRQSEHAAPVPQLSRDLTLVTRSGELFLPPSGLLSPAFVPLGSVSVLPTISGI